MIAALCARPAAALRRVAGGLRRRALLGALLALAGCGGEDGAYVLTCPQALIVADAARLTLYAPGAGRDLLDMRFDASIAALDWTCEFFPGENRVDVELRTALRALRGPAAEAPSVSLPVFVAVADPQGQLLARRVFQLEIGFPGAEVEVGHIWPTRQSLPLGPGRAAADYTLYVGYRLTRDQLAEARAAAP